MPDPAHTDTLDKVAREIEALPSPGFAGTHLVVRLITEADTSHQPEATLLTGELPSLDQLPTAPRREDHPLDFDEASVAYLRAHREVEQAVADTQVAASELADRLQALHWQPAGTTDVGGCVVRGAQMLTNRDGDRTLVVVSDLLDGGGTPVDAAVPLGGTEVRVFHHCNRDASTCSELREGWTASFDSAGASPVRWFGTDESAPILGLSSGVSR